MKTLQQMKWITIVAIVFLMANAYFPTYAQNCFQNNYNGFITSNTNDYLNVNRNNFIVTNAGSDLENYHHTALKLAIEIGKIADVNGNEVTCSTNGFHSNTPINIMNKYTAYRVEYTPEIQASSLAGTAKFKLRAIVIKPSNANNAPCVFIGHGLGGVLRDWRAYYLYGVMDYLMKGYVVVFYEGITTNRNVPDILWNCAFPKNIGSIMSLNLIPDPFNNANRWKYLSLVTAEAIVKFTLMNSNIYNVNSNNLFANGYSFGTTHSEAILFMKKSEFPTSAWSGNYMTPKNLTISSAENFSYNIKSGVIVSGSYVDNLADHFPNGNPPDVRAYTPDDSLKRLLMIHGKQDVAASISEYDSVYPRKINALNNSNIKNYLITICDEGHTVYKIMDVFANNTKNILKTNDRNYPFYNFVRNLTTTNINTMASTINGNATYKAFFDTLRVINSQAFQIYKAGSEFYVNTMNNTPYVMCATENTYNRKSYIGINGNPTPTPYISGNWIYQIRNANCQPISGQRISMEQPVLPIPYLAKYNLYPNPSKGIINTNVTLEQDINSYQIRIYNAQGAVVLEQNVNEQLDAGTILQKQIDLSQQASGMYYIQIKNGEKILMSERIILNK
jgi:hypothetical protein